MGVETSKSEKAVWQEKKKHGSKKERRAAVSVQIGRVAEKLHERAENLERSGTRFPSHGVRSGRRRYVESGYRPFNAISSRDKIYKSDFLEIPEKGRAVTIQYAGPNGSSERLKVDPTGKYRPSDSMSDRFRVGHTTWVLQPSAEDMVEHSAPVFKQIKKEIDQSEEIGKAD